MPTEFSGKQFLASVTELRDKSSSNISKIRETLSPMLAVQGKTLESDETFASIVKDIDKLTTVEKHINNGSLKDMNYVESGLFTNSIIPSNIVMIGDTRSVFVEEGLFYIIDFDVNTLKVTKKEVHKIKPLWDMCANNNQVNLVLGTEVVWAVPAHGDYILGLKGDGVFSSGNISYMKIPIDQDLTISDFKAEGRNIAFISNENRYYRIDGIYDSTEGWTKDNWHSFSMNRCYATCICDGNLDYVATRYGEIWKYDTENGNFVYVNDTKNVTDYEDHYRDLIENPDDYKSILYLAKNDVQWMILEQSNILYFAISSEANIFDGYLEPVELPSAFSFGKITTNKRSYYDRSIVYGYDDTLNAVAYSFRTSYDGIDIIELGDGTIYPQWSSFFVSENGAVMLELYEHIISAAEYYSEAEIEDNGYTDFNYTSLVMRQASYIDYQYIFGPEFNPLFIPAYVKAEKGKTVIVDKGSTSASFNIAVTTDQQHWKLINLRPEDAINVQAMDSGNGIFVLVGLKNDSVLVSKNGFKWEKIALDDNNLELISLTYNNHRNKFYAINYEGTKLVEIDPVEMITTIKDITGIASHNDSVLIKNVCSYAHNIIVVTESNGDIITYKTMSDETSSDIIENGIGRLSLNFFDKTDIYSMVNSALINTFEVADAIYSIHRLNLVWDSNASTEYDRSLLTGVVVCHTKADRELNSAIVGNSDFIYAVFPYDPSSEISGMEYLNHVIIIQQQDKYFIPMNKVSAPICYHYNENGKFFMVQVNAKCGCIGDGYLHLIQSHACNFVRIAYIMSSDQSYSPVVTNVDLYDDKKNVRVNEYQLENDNDNVDRNGNIEVYPVILSNLKAESPGSIIRTDKFIRVGKTDIGYVSEDGLRWEEGFRLPTNGWWRDICYGVNIEGEGIYIAIKYNSTISSDIYYSTDLTNWTKADLPTLGYGWSEIICVDGCFAVSAVYNANSKYILFSLDGKTWDSIMLDHAVDKLRVYSPKDTSFVAFSSIIAKGRETYFVVSSRGKKIVSETLMETAGNISSVKDMIPKTIDDSVVSIPYVIDDRGIIYGSWNVKRVDKRGSLPLALSSTSIFFDDNSNPIIVIYDSKQSCIYIDYFDDENLETYSAVKVDLPEQAGEHIGHFICYNSDKLYIGLSTPLMVDLINTLPDRIDGSFMVENSAEHYQTLPFTPDHVFLFGANSDSSHDKLFFAEIHNLHESSVVFNNTEESLKYRSDVDNVIVEKGFKFVNRTNTDRLINFIAIKENKYE